MESENLNGANVERMRLDGACATAYVFGLITRAGWCRPVTALTDEPNVIIRQTGSVGDHVLVTQFGDYASNIVYGETIAEGQKVTHGASGTLIAAGAGAPVWGTCGKSAVTGATGIVKMEPRGLGGNTGGAILSFCVGLLAGEDTDGAGTNGGGVAGSGAVDIATHMYNAGAGSVLVKVYDHTDVATYPTGVDLADSDDLTHYTAAYQLQPDAASEAAGDYFAVGFMPSGVAKKFGEICFNDLATGAGTLATWGGDGAKWQYWSSTTSAWADLTVFDNTDATAQDGLRTLQRTGTISFTPPTDWGLTTLNGDEAYYIRSVITAAQLTQTALIDATAHDEPMVVIPSANCFISPATREITKLRMTDLGTVHNQNIEFHLVNYTTFEYTAVLTWTASLYHMAFDLSSAPFSINAGDKIGFLVVDDNGSTANPKIYAELS